jgi:hypothetical protein
MDIPPNTRDFRGTWWLAIRGVVTLAVVIVLASSPCSAPIALWQVYAFRDGSFHLLDPSFQLFSSRLLSHSIMQPPGSLVQSTWRVTASALADVTGDGLPEWALLVWRPWRDWPIQRWSSTASPIASFHDAAGNSCHLILLDPRDGHQIWAGSALPAPLLTLAVGDMDGDMHDEVVALEGDYITGREGPATYVVVWKWNGFGFTLEWRSPPGAFRQLGLTNAEGDSILDIVVR